MENIENTYLSNLNFFFYVFSISTLINKFVNISVSNSDHEDLEHLEMKKDIETTNENVNIQRDDIINR